MPESVGTHGYLEFTITLKETITKVNILLKANKESKTFEILSGKKFQSQRVVWHVIKDSDERVYASTSRQLRWQGTNWNNIWTQQLPQSRRAVTASARSLRRGRKNAIHLRWQRSWDTFGWHYLFARTVREVRAVARRGVDCSRRLGDRRLRGQPPPPSPSFTPASLAQNSRTFNAACALFTQNSGLTC